MLDSEVTTLLRPIVQQLTKAEGVQEKVIQILVQHGWNTKSELFDSPVDLNSLHNELMQAVGPEPRIKVAKQVKLGDDDDWLDYV